MEWLTASFLLVFLHVFSTQAELTCKPYLSSDFNEIGPKLTTIGHVFRGVDDLRSIDKSGVHRLIEASKQHGVIVIKGQNLSRQDQINFCRKLGELITLPKEFQPKDSDHDYPSVVDVSNYYRNGTWKGPIGKRFGSYWHKDGNFNRYPRNYILSILHGVDISPKLEGGETSFIDGCAAWDAMPTDLLHALSSINFTVSVTTIPDFAKRLTDELARAFPPAVHQVKSVHPATGRDCLFLYRSTDDTPVADQRQMDEAWKYIQQPRLSYVHRWSRGDVVIWDNAAVFHKAMPLVQNGEKRTLQRTMVRMHQ